MTTELARSNDTVDLELDADAALTALHHYTATGDISRLTPGQRVALVVQRCRKMGVSLDIRPYDFIEFWDPETRSKKLTMYPRAALADALGRIHQITPRKIREEVVGEPDDPMVVIEVEGRQPNGRTAFASKWVPLTYEDRETRQRKRLVGQRLANARMKAETGACRRLIFKMVGHDDPPGPEELQQAKVVYLDAHGNVLEHPTAEQVHLAEHPRTARVLGEPTMESVYDSQGLPDALLPETPDSQPTAAELTRPKPPPERATFRPSKDDVTRWQGRWFATVTGLSLDDDEARHRFVRQWTGGRTESLRDFLTTCTERQADELLAHVEMLMAEEKAAIAAAAEPADENDDTEF